MRRFHLYLNTTTKQNVPTTLVDGKHAVHSDTAGQSDLIQSFCSLPWDILARPGLDNKRNNNKRETVVIVINGNAIKRDTRPREISSVFTVNQNIYRKIIKFGSN